MLYCSFFLKKYKLVYTNRYQIINTLNSPNYYYYALMNFGHAIVCFSGTIIVLMLSVTKCPFC